MVRAASLSRRRHRSANAFLPSDVTGLALWLKGSTLASTYAINDPITTWADSSGSGNDASQSTSARKPTAKTLGSRVAAWCDDSDDVLTLSGVALGTVHTAFIAVKFDAFDGVILGNNSADGYVFYTDATTLYYNTRGGVIASKSHGMVTGTTYILELVRNGVAVDQLRNGTSLGTSTLSGNNNFNNLTSVGAYQTPAAPFGGFIGDVLVYTAALDATQRSNVRRYLAGLHGLTVV